MALSIRNPKVEELARNLSRLSGLGITEEILLSLEERQRVVEKKLSRFERLQAILSGFHGLPDIDQRTPEEILGYDEAGMFSHGH